MDPLRWDWARVCRRVSQCQNIQGFSVFLAIQRPMNGSRHAMMPSSRASEGLLQFADSATRAACKGARGAELESTRPAAKRPELPKNPAARPEPHCVPRCMKKGRRGRLQRGAACDLFETALQDLRLSRDLKASGGGLQPMGWLPAPKGGRGLPESVMMRRVCAKTSCASAEDCRSLLQTSLDKT